MRPTALERLAADPELDRRGPVGLWLLGHSLEMIGAHDRALDVLRRAQRAYPDDYWLNTELGLASLGGVRSGLGATSAWINSSGIPDARYQRAEPYFMAAVALRPRSGTARLLLATAMLSQGKWDECFAEFREALRLQPDDPTIHNSLGVAYQARGEPRRAAAEFSESIRLQPAYTLARGNLGDLLLAQGRPEEAAATFREMIRRTPGFAPAHSRLAQALANLHRLDEAAAAYREAIRLAPRFAVAYAGLGRVLRQLGDFDAASAAFRTAFEIQPDPQWQAMVRHELARTTRWAALAPRLAGVLAGLGPSPRRGRGPSSSPISPTRGSTSPAPPASSPWRSGSSPGWPTTCTLPIATTPPAAPRWPPAAGARANRHDRSRWSGSAPTWPPEPASSATVRTRTGPSSARPSATGRSTRNWPVSGLPRPWRRSPSPSAGDWQALWAEVDSLIASLRTGS